MFELIAKLPYEKQKPAAEVSVAGAISLFDQQPAEAGLNQKPRGHERTRGQFVVKEENWNLKKAGAPMSAA